MASIDFSLFFQRYIPKFVHVLISILLELTLIILHFLNCILFFLITKYASLCGLETPCIICSASVFKISLGTLVCNDHIKQSPLSKRAQKKRDRKDSSGFNYIIYGPPWRVVQYAKNGNVVDRIIKKESGLECCVAGEEEDQKPDFVADDPAESMNNRFIIHEARLASIESVDKVTMEDNSIWFKKEKLNHQNREFTLKDPFQSLQDINTAGDGETKLKNDASDSISAETYSSRKGHVDGSLHHSQNTHSYSSLSDIIPIEAVSFPNLLTGSEFPSPEHNELDKQEIKKKSLSCKSLESCLVMRNKENTERLLHNRNPNSNSCKSMFEIMPFETTSVVNPNTTFEPVSNKYDILEASVVKGIKEETKGEDLVKLNESLEKLEEERCSLTEKLNQLQQRLLIVEKKEQTPEDVIEVQNNLQPDYKSLADIFHREINYSTNDLVSLGKEYNQRRHENLKMKRILPSLHESYMERGENSSQECKLDAGIMEDEKLVIQEEMVKLHERLGHINSEREWIKQFVKSLKEGA